MAVMAWVKNSGASWDMSRETPYIHWWWEKDRPDLGADIDERFHKVPVTFRRPSGGTPAQMDVPVPAFALNPAYQMAAQAGEDPEWSPDDLVTALTPADEASRLPADTVLVGVIDTGIPLGHRRLRTSDGASRVIAAWQQSGVFGGQAHLPFGRELAGAEIDALIAANSGPDGTLDEEAFNRATGLTAPQHHFGLRDLDHPAAHGAHVLDLAAGADAATGDPLENTRIIAVNLPPQYVHGTAGNFLTPYARLAAERILLVADALWQAQYPGRPGEGFPVVINFSFGKQAGPKDGQSTWEAAIAAMLAERQAKAPTLIALPAGNHNLARGQAMAETQPPDPQVLDIPWRLQPQDRTSNFVELWAAKRRANGDGAGGEAPPEDFALEVTPPGSAPLPVPMLVPGEYADLDNHARVYCYRPEGETQTHFVVGARPTDGTAAAPPTAPAGLWSIRLTHTGASPQILSAYIQSDRSGGPTAGTGRPSYFDGTNYQTHMENGRIRDSFDASGPLDGTGPVMRRGSANALATWDGAIVIGGHRKSDSRASAFSATFAGAPVGQAGAKTPTVLYPTDDSPSHFGILAAGSRDGATVAYRGTSMATAMATRELARALIAGIAEVHAGQASAENWLKTLATKAEPGLDERKQGAGLVPDPVPRRIPRLGEN